MWNGSHNLQHLIEKQEQVDQQQQAQLDAVSALASLQQPAAGRFTSATRVDPFTEAYHLVAQAQQQQQAPPMARQFSDGSDPYGRTTNGAAAFPGVDASALLNAQATFAAAAAASYPELAAASSGSGVSSYPASISTATAAYSPESPSFEQQQQSRATSPPTGYVESNGGTGTTTANGFAYEQQQQSYEQPTPAPRGKPEAMARALAASQLEADAAAAAASDDDELPPPPPPPPPRKTPKKKATTPKKKKKSASTAAAAAALIPARRSEYVMGEVAPPITADEYANLDELLTEFCRVPLLADFSRPVSLLHPDVRILYYI